MPGLTAEDERRLAALPKEASDALAPVLGEPAANWTMAKAGAVGRAVELTGVRFTVVPPAESLSPAQRAMLELCATHAELGLQGGVIYKWPRWSMRRWLGLDLPGALERKGADGRARWQRLAPSDRGTDGDAVRALLDELPMAERLEVFGEVDAGAYGLSARLGNTPARYAWLEVPGLDDLGVEGATWAPRHADFLLGLLKPGTEPHHPFRLDPAGTIQLALFLALARARVPIEPRWDDLFPSRFDRSDLFVEALEALPSDRRRPPLERALTVFLAATFYGRTPPASEPAQALAPIAPLLAKYPVGSLLDALEPYYLAGLSQPKRQIQAQLTELGKRLPALAPTLTRDASKKPLKLVLRLTPLPPPAQRTPLDRDRLARLDEHTEGLVEQIDVTDESSGRRWQALLHAGSDGQVFPDGSAEPSAMIAQGGADGSDAAFCNAFDAALAAARKKGKAKKGARKAKGGA